MTPAMDPDLREKLRQIIEGHEVVLFMKGTRGAPQCGFSAQVIQILDGLSESYETVNVLADPAVREGIKQYASWPTIPQLYVKGKLVGGCDIVTEMFEDGSLASTLGVTVAPVEPPRVHVSARAGEALSEVTEGTGEVVRLEVSNTFEHGLIVGPTQPGDVQAEVEGAEVSIVLDPKSARRASGVTIDFIDTAQGPAFKIENPNAPPKVQELTVEALAEKLKSGEVTVLLDVRTPEERAIASIEGSRLLDHDVLDEIDALERDVPIALVCHHGMRSRAAAEQLLARGFRRVFNVTGGIEAWSLRVDPNVPRY